MNDVAEITAAETGAEPPGTEPEFTPFAPRRVFFNTPREAENRYVTVGHLGPPPGTAVEVELKPAQGDDAPIVARGRVNNDKHVFIGAQAPLPDDWPELARFRPRGAVENCGGYVARYRLLPPDALDGIVRRHSTNAEVDRLKAELKVERAKSARLEGELEQQLQLVAFLQGAVAEVDAGEADAGAQPEVPLGDAVEASAEAADGHLEAPAELVAEVEPVVPPEADTEPEANAPAEPIAEPEADAPAKPIAEPEANVAPAGIADPQPEVAPEAGDAETVPEPEHAAQTEAEPVEGDREIRPDIAAE